MQHARIGMRVRREAAQLTRPMLAEMAGCSLSMIASMEHGYRPSKALTERVAAALDCAPHELFELARLSVEPVA